MQPRLTRILSVQVGRRRLPQPQPQPRQRRHSAPVGSIHHLSSCSTVGGHQSPFLLFTESPTQTCSPGHVARRRFFSTTTTTTTTHGDDGTIANSSNNSNRPDAATITTAARETTTQIVHVVKVGDMTPDQFRLALDLIQFWTFIITDNSTTTTTTTTTPTTTTTRAQEQAAECVHSSFALLERLMQELEARPSSSMVQELPNRCRKTVQSTFVVRRVVQHWQHCWTQQQQQQQQQQQHQPHHQLLTPQEVLDQVENWTRRSNRLVSPIDPRQLLLQPDVLTYNAILHSFFDESVDIIAKSTTKNHRQRNYSTNEQDQDFPLFYRHQKALIRRAEQVQRVVDLLRQQQQYLQQYLQQQQNNDNNNNNTSSSSLKQMSGITRPNSTSYRKAMEAWLDARRIDKFFDILDMIVQDNHNHNNNSIKSKHHHRAATATATTASVNSNNNDETQEADKHDVDTTTSVPLVRFASTTFEQALQSCVERLPKSQQQEAGILAEKVLWYMEQFHDHCLLGQKPHVGHHTQVIQAWAKSKHPQAGTRVMEIWNHLWDQSSKNNKVGGPNSSYEPDVTTYNAVLHTFAGLGDMERAESLLAKLCMDYNQGKSRIQPDAQCFSTVLAGWSRINKSSTTTSSRIDTGEKAETLLRLMWDMYLENPTALKRLQPDEVCYGSVMHAYVTSGHPSAGPEAERLFHELLEKSQHYPNLEPSTKTYGVIINAWAKVGEVDQASKILAFMCDEYQKRIRSTPDSNRDAAEPDVTCFNILLNAYAQSHNVIAGAEANRLLQKMWELDQQQEDFGNIRPNANSYSSVINAWAKSGHSDAGEHAERLLQELHEKYRETGDVRLKPTVVAYNSVIIAWGRCGNYPRARAIFSRMYHNKGCNSTSSQNNGNDDDETDIGDIPYRHVNTYNSLLDALSRSNEHRKGEKADTIILAMELRKIKPDKVTYSLAHKCWHQDKRSNHEKAAFRLNVLKEQIEHFERKSQKKSSTANG